MNQEKTVRVLMTGPDKNPATSLGGIVTVVNMILSNSNNIRYFDRDMGTKGKAVTFIKKLWSFRKVLKQEKPDCIHFHFSFDDKSIMREALYIRLAKRTGRPLIVHLHGGVLLFQQKKSKLINWILSAATRIIVLSDIEKDSLASLYQVPAEKIIILRNCIDLKEIPAFGNEQSGGDNLIFFGRLHESKGIDDITAACKLLKQQSVDFRFSVCGAGPEKEQFTQSMSTLLTDRFNYKGLVWGEKKWEALQESDVFLLPSRYGEGLPMALLEAMALGKVVIVTDDASITRVVQDNYNGILINKKSPQQLAEKIGWILSDRESQRRLGQNAIKTIQSEYSSDYYIHSLNKVYQGLQPSMQ